MGWVYPAESIRQESPVEFTQFLLGHRQNGLAWHRKQLRHESSKNIQLRTHGVKEDAAIK